MSPSVENTLIEACKGRLTGCLELRAGDKETRLYLRDGSLVATQVGFGYQTPLQAMLSGKKLSAEGFDAAWARGDGLARDDDTLDAARADANDVAMLHARATVKRTVSLAQTATFTPGAGVEGAAVLTPAGLVRATLELRVSNDVPHMVRVRDLEEAQSWVGSDSERRWLSSLEEFRSEAELPDERRGLVGALVALGAVERLSVEAWQATTVTAVDLQPSDPVPSAREPVPLDQAFQAPTGEERVILEQHRAQDDFLKRLNVALSQSAPVDDRPRVVTTAELEATHQSVPVVHFTPPGAPPPAKSTLHIDPFDGDDMGDPNDPNDPGRLRRLRLLRQGMENLGARVPRAPVVPEADLGHAPTPQAPAPDAAPAGTPTADDAAFAKRLDERHAQVVAAQGDAFTLLGLTENASSDQAKAAYYEAAKVFHPDKLPASLRPMAGKMNEVFNALRDAYDALSDDVRKANYLSARKAKAESMAAAAARAAGPTGDELMKMGDAFFKKRDFRQAEEHFARAFTQDKKAVALAARAWAIYMDPSRKGEVAQAKQMMADAIKTDPNCDRAYYQLGVIARVEGDMVRAERQFRDAVRVNAKHLEANQELRLIEMRKKKSGGK